MLRISIGFIARLASESNISHRALSHPPIYIQFQVDPTRIRYVFIYLFRIAIYARTTRFSVPGFLGMDFLYGRVHCMYVDVETLCGVCVCVVYARQLMFSLCSVRTL